MIRSLMNCLPYACLLVAASANAGDLQVNLQDIRVQTGTLHMSVVDGPDGWNQKAKPVQAQSAKVTGDTAHFDFKNLPAGDYAVMVTQDENDNGKLDTNMLGVPVEGYGFSNNPQVMRKPTWEEARVHVPAEGSTITIILR
ncbi:MULTISPECIES: DUF2141 domain-containing protein [unclassified Stenotrophomonas]|uniref:DUF2141 domain-containing protein n=1 Tax=unclassified Stenotrophomonas TaxID=196198 RepID=UPI00249C3AEF|nr:MULTISPECIES: DUF2141 domain-containing protein [unclassified Stenotrophomonas]